MPKLFRTPKCDNLDLQIIEKLVNNGRMSFKRIGEEIGVSTDTVSRRYRKLRNNGTIKVVIQINASKLGYTAALNGKIKLKSHMDIDKTINALARA